MDPTCPNMRPTWAHYGPDRALHGAIGAQQSSLLVQQDPTWAQPGSNRAHYAPNTGPTGGHYDPSGLIMCPVRAQQDQSAAQYEPNRAQYHPTCSLTRLHPPQVSPKQKYTSLKYLCHEIIFWNRCVICSRRRPRDKGGMEVAVQRCCFFHFTFIRS